MKVERFRNAMVGRAIELHLVGDEALQRIGEVGARRIENCHVIEPGGAGRRRLASRTLPGVEANVVVVAAGGHESRLLAIHLLQFEAEHAAIEVEGPLDVGHLEVNMANARAGRDRGGGNHEHASLL